MAGRVIVLTARKLDDETLAPARPWTAQARALLKIPAGYGGHGRWLTPSDEPALRALLGRCRHEVVLTAGAARAGDAARLLRTGGAATAGAPKGARFLAGLFSPDGELNAFVEVVRNFPARRTLTIASLVVRPELRGCGLAAEILETVERWARAERASAVYLHVPRRNPGAMAFALRSGFVDAGDAPPLLAVAGAPRLARMARGVER